MKIDEYRNMYELELKHWWYKGLDCLLFQIVKKLNLPSSSKVLDAGCGTGRVLQKLHSHYDAYGIDYSYEALRFCGKRGLDRFVSGTLVNLPYHSEQFNLIICTDVLYHEGISDDQLALREFYRVLKPGGTLILHLPALEILRGKHDKQVSTRERYTKAIILKRIQDSGFQVVFATYRLFFLFPFFLMVRLFQKDRENVKSDLSLLPGWINQLLYKVVWIENKWLCWFSAPIGPSILLVAKKIEMYG